MVGLGKHPMSRRTTCQLHTKSHFFRSYCFGVFTKKSNKEPCVSSSAGAAA